MLFPTQSHAGKIDYEYVLANSLLIVDWMQTREIEKYPNLSEGNFILGPNPSRYDIDRYFFVTVAAYNVAYYALPKKWSKRVTRVLTFVEIGCVGNNYYLGIRIIK